MTEKKVLYVRFIDAEGKTSSVSIENPKVDLTLETVRGVAETIVSQQAIEGTGGALTAFRDAFTVTTVTTPLV